METKTEVIQLTKEQRHEVYKKVSEFLKQPYPVRNCTGVCDIIYHDIVRIDFSSIWWQSNSPIDLIKKQFPEFFKYHDPSAWLWWFKNDSERIAAIENCIKETESE